MADLITTGTALLVGKKLLGKTMDIVSEDISKLYTAGRDKIIEKATSKVSDINDGKQTNLRVTRDVFWNGSFTEEAICAEYFGGILASSRSDDGKDDNGIHYTDVIKSLSSKQLQLHYVIYNSLNKLLVRSDKNLNVGQATDLQQKAVWFSAVELADILNLKIDTDLNVLYKQGLLHEYKTDTHKLEDDKTFPYVMIRPTTFGVLLYSIAHNKFDVWSQFSVEDFGDFVDIKLPNFFEGSIDNLLEKTGLNKKD